ncbi:MAG: Arm DNA-binding domain-containing protein [Xanthobacteraceae bacterium]
MWVGLGRITGSALSQHKDLPRCFSHRSVQNAKPKEKPYKLSDGNGLHLSIKPNGSKLWPFRYQFERKEKMISLGSFPEVPLASDRSKRDDARKLVAAGIDPSQQKKQDKIAAALSAENTFAAIAEEQLKELQENGAAAAALKKVRWLLLDQASALIKRPIAEITPAEILPILKKLEKAGRRETARRLRGTLGTVFRGAVATLRATNDPTYALQDALAAAIVVHRPPTSAGWEP